MKQAIVTGAAAGIGAVVAREAAAAGYRVGLIDRDGALAEKAAREIPNAVALAADVSDEAQVEAALDAFGETPDLVVNNAGIVRFGPLAELSAADWRVVVDVNLSACFIVGRAAAVRMFDAGGGAIINVTSINGVLPGPNAGAYGSAKAGVALLTQQMALEWGPLGVRVNAVAPGLIDGGMSAPIYADEVVRKARESKVPLGRLGTPEDIASAILFLGSEAASYITGQNLVVDGGVAMGMIGQLPRPQAVDRGDKNS